VTEETVVESPLHVPLVVAETNWGLAALPTRSVRVVLRAELDDSEFARFPLKRFLPWEPGAEVVP